MTGTQPGQQPEHDPPPFPNPDRPDENQPMHDPPVIPERDEALQADGSTQRESGGDKASQGKGDKKVVFDANRIEK